MMKLYKVIISLFVLINSYSAFSQEYESEIDSLKSVLKENKNSDTNKVNTLNDLALKLYGDSPELAIDYGLSALELSQRLNFSNGEARANKVLGISYCLKSDYEKSLNYFFNSLDIYEKKHDNQNIGSIYNNLGNIYWYLGKCDEAIIKLLLAADYFDKLNDSKRLSTVYMNLGAIYDEIQDYKKSKEYYDKSLEIKQLIDDKDGTASVYNNMGQMYYNDNEINMSIIYFQKAFLIYEKLDDKLNLPIVLINLSSSYLKLEDYDKSLAALNSALDISKNIDNKNIIKEIYLAYYEYYFELKKYDKALENYKISNDIKDSIFNREKSEQLIEIQTKYETEKTAKENELLLANQETNKLTIQRQKIFFFTLLSISILIILVALQLFKLNKQKKRTNEILSAKSAEIFQQKEEILTQNEVLQQSQEEIEAQRDKIELQRDYAIKQHETILEQNQYIKDSIVYASRIQKALFPSNIDIENNFLDFFIFLKPRNIVSGDFYWYKNINNYKFLAVADCTGHGVPGAFMSLLGISFLNEISTQNIDFEPAYILEELRLKVKSALTNSDYKHNQRDGMDIAICKIDENKKILTYAGANNSIYLVSNNNFTEHKAIKNPVGSYINEKSFENIYINYMQNDKLYLFTDGYMDQINGITNEKYKTIRFKNLITECSTSKMSEQKIIIENEFEKWKTPDFKQIDDILIIGINLK